MDIGPGNCLIDKWIRLNSDKKLDENGNLARIGKIDKLILDKTLDKYYQNNTSKKKSLDTNDFDNDVFVCGGGRKNKFLIEALENKIGNKIVLIDNLGIDGDFIESQAFAYLSIRSYLGLPISFPETTGCKEPSTGGIIIENC